MTTDPPVTGAGFEEGRHPRDTHGRFRRLDTIMADLTDTIQDQGGGTFSPSGAKVAQAKSAIQSGDRSKARAELDQLAQTNPDPKVQSLVAEAKDRLKPTSVGFGRKVGDHTVHDVSHPDHGHIGTVSKSPKHLTGVRGTEYRANPEGPKGDLRAGNQYTEPQVKAFPTRAQATHHLAEQADARAAEGGPGAAGVPPYAGTPDTGTTDHPVSGLMPITNTLPPEPYGTRGMPVAPTPGARVQVHPDGRTGTASGPVRPSGAGGMTVPVKWDQPGAGPDATELPGDVAPAPIPGERDHPESARKLRDSGLKVGDLVQENRPSRSQDGKIVRTLQPHQHEIAGVGRNGNAVLRHPETGTTYHASIENLVPAGQSPATSVAEAERTGHIGGADPAELAKRRTDGELQGIARNNPNTLEGRTAANEIARRQAEANRAGRPGPLTPRTDRQQAMLDSARAEVAARSGDGPQTVHLQGIGKHPAKPVSELKPGDRVVHNYGETSTVVGPVEPSTIQPINAPDPNAMHTIMLRDKNGNIHKVQKKGGTMVGWRGAPLDAGGDTTGGAPDAPEPSPDTAAPADERQQLRDQADALRSGRSAKMQRAFKAASDGDHEWLAAHGFNAEPGDTIHADNKNNALAFEKPGGGGVVAHSVNGNGQSMHGHGSRHDRLPQNPALQWEKVHEPRDSAAPAGGPTPDASVPSAPAAPGRSAKMQRAFTAAEQGDHTWLASHGFDVHPGEPVHVNDASGEIAIRKPDGSHSIHRVNGNGQAAGWFYRKPGDGPGDGFRRVGGDASGTPGTVPSASTTDPTDPANFGDRKGRLASEFDGVAVRQANDAADHLAANGYSESKGGGGVRVLTSPDGNTQIRVQKSGTVDRLDKGPDGHFKPTKSYMAGTNYDSTGPQIAHHLDPGVPEATSTGAEANRVGGTTGEYRTEDPRTMHGGMTARQVYKGRDLEVKKGKEWGTLETYVNGQLVSTPSGRTPEQVQQQLSQLQRNVDAADEPGADYGDYFKPKDKYQSGAAAPKAPAPGEGRQTAADRFRRGQT